MQRIFEEEATQAFGAEDYRKRSRLSQNNIKPTVTGKRRTPSAFVMPLVLSLVGVGLFVALLTDRSALMLLCILVFSMSGGAKAYSLLSLFKIRSQLRIDKDKVFPSETLALTIKVENRKPLPVWLQVKVPLGSALRAGAGATNLKQDSGIFSYQRLRFEWQLAALRRGVHSIGPVELEAADPLGFFPQKKKTEFTEVVVYPRLVPLNRLLLPRRDFFGKPGVNSAVEDPTYIHGTRDYQCGRPASHIHWKASARHDRLMEKLCEPAVREKVLILVRADRFIEDPTGESLESCLEVAASLVVQLDRLRFSVGLATNGRLNGGGKAIVSISRNPCQLSNILETMARFEPEPVGDMLDLLPRGLTLPWTVTGVCFTYALDAGSLSLYQYFKHRRVPMVMVICDRDAQRNTFATITTEEIYRLDDIRMRGDVM